jgi:hypothetical protein
MSHKFDVVDTNRLYEFERVLTYVGFEDNDDDDDSSFVQVILLYISISTYKIIVMYHFN